jgi:hypothetical protein
MMEKLRHAQPAAHHVPRGLQLLHDVDGHGNGDRKGKADRAAAARVDLRIDADYLAIEVEQRSSGVARIDRHVGLDERHVVAGIPVARQAAPARADDARGDRVVEAKGRADRHHPLAHLELVGIAEAHDRQIPRLDLEQRDIGALVAADDPGLELAAVRQAHRHGVGPVDHVVIGQDVAVGRDQEARTHGLALALRLAAVLEQVAEDLRHLLERARIDVGRQAFHLRRLLRAHDLDDRSRVLLDDRGEVRQCRRPRLAGQRQHQRESTPGRHPVALHRLSR